MDIGIDLGTTYSVVAVAGKHELAADYSSGIYLEECDVTIIPTPYGEQTFASVILENPDQRGTYLFGTDALQKAEEGFAPIMFSKRKIGTREAIPMLDGTMTAKEVAEQFLRHMKACAELALGRTVNRAVVTHPAYFDRGAVQETREAAIAAGFDMSLPEQMLMEPVAAALAYTRTDARDPLRILAYDLGGGTFDVTYLERNAGVIEMRAFDGDPLLGGYNFDRELLHWVRQQLTNQGRRIVLDEQSAEDRGRLAQLLRVAEQTKIKLAEAATPETMVWFRAQGILVDVDGKQVQVAERLTREQFVKLIQGHLQQTIKACERALAKGGVSAGEVNELILVGGSTYGPWVQEAVQAAFPQTSPKRFHPDLCVGVGAAIQAKLFLPPLVDGGEFRLLLDVPERALLDVIAIAGRVIDKKTDLPPSAPLAMTLELPDGSSQQSPLSESGSFYFGDNELRGEEPQHFKLTLRNSAQEVVLAHPFSVTYAPHSTEASSVSTVLPKPLYIETLDGPAPLAVEGVTLPARCQQTFQRQNDNANISLRLFQGPDPIGEIRIEQIPKAAGRGALVDLQVEVTEKSQIRGTARIRTKAGAIVLQQDVLVHFEIPDVPPASELADKLDELRFRYLQLLLDNPERGEHLTRQVQPLLDSIGRLFEQQPLERPEIFVALRQLEHLLHPPEDDMRPTKEEFLAVVGRCLGAIDLMEQKAIAALEHSPGAEDAAASAARKNQVRASHYRQLVNKCAADALPQHARRDRKQWALAFDALTDIEAVVREQPDRATPPTIISKLFAIMSLRRQLERLDAAADELSNQGRIADWQDELQRIERELQAAHTQIGQIDDSLAPETGLAQIRLIHSRVVRPATEAIGRLGGDVRMLHDADQ